ncbi:hypothetical protein SteCoe_9030 [Stentor coeruleus]|uniref:WWE domain-containing protein n=1 Tax=Stentor coeruleus TaxID=5963 RepID=A0A1R2CIQ7_9CILI|nr:hypothetical protein SteCoe_9030 [Stentor coeruleus]
MWNNLNSFPQGTNQNINYKYQNPNNFLEHRQNLPNQFNYIPPNIPDSMAPCMPPSQFNNSYQNFQNFPQNYCYPKLAPGMPSNQYNPAQNYPVCNQPYKEGFQNRPMNHMGYIPAQELPCGPMMGNNLSNNPSEQIFEGLKPEQKILKFENEDLDYQSRETNEQNRLDLDKKDSIDIEKKSPPINPIPNIPCEILNSKSSQKILPHNCDTTKIESSSIKLPEKIENLRIKSEILVVPQSTTNSENFKVRRIPISSNVKKNDRVEIINKIRSSIERTQIEVESAGKGQKSFILKGPENELEMCKEQISITIHQTDEEDQWHYLNDFGQFMPYSFEENKKIKSKFAKGRKKVRIGNERTIIFGSKGVPHVQSKNNGIAARTVRRGLATIINQLSPEEFIWYWTSDNGKLWNPYAPEAVKQIEYYYQIYLKNVKIEELDSMDEEERNEIACRTSVLIYGTSRFSYKIDYVNFVQFNEQTTRWRGIKRWEAEGVLRLSKFGVRNDKVPWIPRKVE